MRPLEIVTAVLVSGTAILAISGRFRKLALCMWLVTGLLILAHLLWEGPRLQAAPIYLGAILLGLNALAAAPVVVRASISLAAGILAGVGALACRTFPVFTFPPPGGSYAIGTHTFYLTDPNRLERYAAEGGRSRRVAAQVWYPATKCSASYAEYRDPRTLIWKSAHLRYVRTHGCVDAPFGVREGGWPAVFFSPSSGGFRSQNTFLTEYLVSRGYIVIGLDHPDTCARVAFPDGVIIHSLPDVWLNLESKADLAKSTPRTEDVLHTNVQDIQFVYSLLKNASDDPHLAAIGSRIDFSRCAAIGHSFGGAAAAELCRIDPRFLAGVNLDGWMFSGVRENGVPKPFLFMVEDDPLWEKNEPPFEDTFDGVVRLGTADYKNTIAHSVATWGGCVARLIHGTHGDFSDIALFVRPWPWERSQQPTIQTKHEVVRRLVLAFLDEHLRDKRGAIAQASREIGEALELTTYSAYASPGKSQVRKVRADE